MILSLKECGYKNAKKKKSPRASCSPISMFVKDENGKGIKLSGG